MNRTSEPATASEVAVAVASHRRALLRRTISAGVWILAYVMAVAVPLLMLLRGTLARGGGFWWDFAMALGFGGLAMLGAQSVLTARFRRTTAPFGVDIIYYFHRLAALAGFALIVAHYVILRVRYGEALGPANPLVASWPMTAGRMAFVLFAALIVSSLWRQALRIEYDRWRVAHAVLAVGAVSLAIAHISGVGHYANAVWKGLPWVLFSLLWILIVAYVRIGRPWSLLREPYRVVSVQKERGRSWTLKLQPEGHVGLNFSPGQFAWLVLRASPFRAKEHPFSFSGSAAEKALLQFTIKELGDFTSTIKDVQPGELAYVDGPHGVFTTDHHAHAPGFVFVAGGVGIAPIMSMLRTLADRGDRRPIRLLYGNRCWDDVTFREEIDALRARLNLVVAHVLQEPPVEWTGLHGVLSETVLRSSIPDDAPVVSFSSFAARSSCRTRCSARSVAWVCRCIEFTASCSKWCRSHERKYREARLCGCGLRRGGALAALRVEAQSAFARRPGTRHVADPRRRAGKHRTWTRAVCRTELCDVSLHRRRTRNPRHPLDGIGARSGAEELREWITATVVPKKNFKLGGAAEDQVSRADGRRLGCAHRLCPGFPGEEVAK